MRRISLFASVILVFIACNNADKNTVTVTDSSGNTQTTNGINVKPDSTLQGCYSYINSRDTASLQMSIDKGNISGSLSYNIEGKDRNDGTFQGEMKGDRLELWYLYRSEGIMSVRQEIFRIAGRKLIPATGPVTVRNDTAMFTDPAKLSFDSTRAFVKVQCVI